ncbi:transcription factor Adf-1 [Bactrocera dorsalis]|uniref:Transcription factor Adf-1 n=1 Tax=Bactrocera dorsalis TaxID=27457 RepID=A0A6I9VJD2_BACDO|nr:transcription factor Adf-1 [Bactrocera dorsalis]
MDDIKLIECVRNSPCLYDKSHADFKNQEKKRRSWKEVADNLEVDESVVMKRWGNLRERFSKEIRISQNASGSGAFVGRQWALFESLQILRSHIIPRPMRQSAPILKRSDENYDFINISSESQDLSPSPPISPGQLISSDQSTIILSDQTTAIPSDQSIPSNQPSANPSSISRPRKRRGRQLDEVDTAILGTVKTFQEVCERRARREEFNVEISGFGRMICSSISKMKKSRQALVMRQCTDIVMQAQIDEEEESFVYLN